MDFTEIVDFCTTTLLLWAAVIYICQKCCRNIFEPRDSNRWIAKLNSESFIFPLDPLTEGFRCEIFRFWDENYQKWQGLSYG